MIKLRQTVLPILSVWVAHLAFVNPAFAEDSGHLFSQPSTVSLWVEGQIERLNDLLGETWV